LPAPVERTPDAAHARFFSFRPADSVSTINGIEHMFDSGFAADAAQCAVLGARLVARFDTEMGGPQAAESLSEVLAGVRSGELLSCQVITRSSPHVVQFSAAIV
jgi:hypothetical protein